MKTISGEFIYWSEFEIPSNPRKIITTVPYQYPRTKPLPYSAKAVQGTAYALLVYLQNNWFSEAQPIMQWLQTQRDAESGFIGSQVD